jgi:two-component sensor histidine kinase
MLVLYDKLFLSSDFQKVSTRQYFETLINEIIENFPKKDIVDITYEIEDVMLSAKTIFDLGIIINELITNTMKHAFVGKELGKINASLSVDQGHAIFTIQDQSRNDLNHHIQFLKSGGNRSVGGSTNRRYFQIAFEANNTTNWYLSFHLFPKIFSTNPK